jgi:hypothetical protein
VDTPTVQGLHGALGGAGIIVLNESVVVPILVRDDLDVLNVTRSLKDLTEDILGDTGIKSANIESPLIRLGRGTAGKWAGATRRHQAAFVTSASHRRSDSGRDGICILRDMQRRGRQMARSTLVLTILVARSANIGLWRRRQGRSRDVGHVVDDDGLPVEVGCRMQEKARASGAQAQLGWPLKGITRNRVLCDRKKRSTECAYPQGETLCDRKMDETLGVELRVDESMDLALDRDRDRPGTNESYTRDV